MSCDGKALAIDLITVAKPRLNHLLATFDLIDEPLKIRELFVVERR